MKPIKLKGFDDHNDFAALAQIVPMYRALGERPLGIIGCMEYETNNGRRYIVYETRTLTVIVRQQ